MDFFLYYGFHCLIFSCGRVGFFECIYGYRVCACAPLKGKYAVKYHLGFVEHCVNSRGYREEGCKKGTWGAVISGGWLHASDSLSLRAARVQRSLKTDSIL